MKSGSNTNNAHAGKEEDASFGGRYGKPPHWRRREHAATTVYVVHPTQFRAVVQQLTGGTGAASPPPLSTHQHVAAGGGGGGNGAAAGTRTNAVAQAQAHHGRGEQGGGGGRWRTLGQMHQDCLDWANADDN